MSATAQQEQEPACDICFCDSWSSDCECNCHAWFAAELADALEKRFPGHCFLTALLDALDETDISLERGSFIEFNGKR